MPPAFLVQLTFNNCSSPSEPPSFRISVPSSQHHLVLPNRKKNPQGLLEALTIDADNAGLTTTDERNFHGQSVSLVKSLVESPLLGDDIISFGQVPLAPLSSVPAFAKG